MLAAVVWAGTGAPGVSDVRIGFHVRSDAEPLRPLGNPRCRPGALAGVRRADAANRGGDDGSDRLKVCGSWSTELRPRNGVTAQCRRRSHVRNLYPWQPQSAARLLLPQRVRGTHFPGGAERPPQRNGRSYCENHCCREIDDRVEALDAE
jgi:hypothetical protein